MAYFIQYPDVGNTNVHECVTPDVRIVLEHYMQSTAVRNAIVHMLQETECSCISVHAVATNGIEFAVDNSDDVVHLNLGLDVLESDNLGYYLENIPSHVHHMIGSTDGSDSDDDDEDYANLEDNPAEAPLP